MIEFLKSCSFFKNKVRYLWGALCSQLIGSCTDFAKALSLLHTRKISPFSAGKNLEVGAKSNLAEGIGLLSNFATYITKI